MPGRVNTKFVLILVTCIAAVVVLLGGIYYFQIRRNPANAAAKAAVYMREGDYNRAIEGYRRAAILAKTDVSYWDKLVEAVHAVPVDLHATAQRYSQLLIAATRQKAEIAVNDEAVQREYYQLLCDMAERLGHHSLYQQLHTDTTARLDAQPDFIPARKYRGIARVHMLIDRGDQFDVPRNDQLTAQQDLVDALDRTPNDTDALYALTQWVLFDARWLRHSSGSGEEIQRRRTEALNLSQRMLAIDPQSPRLMLRHARVCLTVAEDHARDARPDTAQVEALRERAGELAAAVADMLKQSDTLADTDTVMLVVEASTLLQLTDNEIVDAAGTGVQTTRGRLRALELFDAALAKAPDTVDYLVQRGILLMSVNRNDEALAAFEQARRPGRTMPAVEMLRTQNQQVTASVQTGNILITRIAMSNDEAEKKQLAQRVRGLIAEIEPAYGRVPVLDLLEGKLKLTENELAAALQLFDKAARATGETDQEAMRLAASVARQLGDWGDAARRLEILITRNPANLQARLEVTEIYLTGGMIEQARNHLNLLLAYAPDQPLVQMLHANYLATTGEVDKAIAIYESQDPTTNVNIDPILARLYVMAGRNADAQALLARRFEQNPTDVRTLQTLLRLTDADQRQPYLQAAADAGVEPQTIRLIERQLSPEPITIEELEDLMPQTDSDPFRLAMAQAQRLAASGDMEGAEQKLAEAAALKPDDKTLIELRFGLALQRKDWEQANRLADRARSLNVDLAEGAFFRAQLAEARGDLAGAEAEYVTALNVRPIFSDGWRMLGDVRARLNRLQPALDAYRRSLEQHPNDSTTLDHISRVEVQSQLFADALRHARDAWRYRPNDRAMLERYIEMERAYGDPAAALELRRQLARSQPQDADNRRSLVRLLHERGEREQAMSMLDELIESEGLTRQNALTRAQLLLIESHADEGERVLLNYLAGLGDKAEAADHAVLAQYRLFRGDLAGAISAYNDARRLDKTENMLFTRMLGDELFARGVNDQAVELYQQVLDKTPDDLGVRLRLAETLMRTGELDRTRQLLRGVDPTEPADKSTLMVLQSVLALPPDKDPNAAENTQAKNEALRLANLAIQQSDRNATAYTRRAALLAGDPQRVTGMINDLNRALEINPNLAEARGMLVDLYLRRNDLEEATRELRQLLKQQPGNAQARVMLVDLYQRNNDRLSAQQLIDEAIRQFPQEPLWQGLRAQLALSAGDTTTALRFLKQQMDLRATPSTIGQYVLQLLALGRAGEALSTLEEQAGVVNQDLVLQALRARALAADGKTDQAEQLFINIYGKAESMPQVGAITGQLMQTVDASRALALVRRVPTMREPKWLSITEGHMLVRGRQFDAAIAVLEPLRSSLPSDGPTRVSYLQEMAQAYQMAGRPREAKAAYDELLVLSPQDPGALNNLAYLLLEDLNQPAEALAMAERAAAAMPDNAAVLDTLGWAQYKSGQLEQARRTLENSVSRQPLAPSCLHLAQVYQDLGMSSRSREMLMRAIELADESEAEYRQQAEQMLERLSAASAP